MNSEQQGAPDVVMILAGEVSGDHHAARLVREVLARRPGMRFFGVGGDAMRAAGVETLVDIEAMAVTGLSEVAAKYLELRRIFYLLLAAARARRPAAVILVDYPGFNLRFAARAHALGLRTIYYICPQVWAWRRGRIPRMARILDRLIALFPFEEACFAGSGLHVDFVGHPLVDETDAVLRRPPPELPWQGSPRVALLPGSRDHEIERLLPVMWDAAMLIEQRHPSASFLVPAATDAAAARIERIAAAGRVPAHWQVVPGMASDVLRTARAALIASGTATLEAALLRCPMVVTYKTTPLTYLVGRALIRVKHLGIVNIIGGREVCPELVQHRATGANLADAIEPLLTDTQAHARMGADLDAIRESLGGGGAVARAAEVVLDAMAGSTPAPAY